MKATPMDNPTTEPKGCPAPGACSAMAEIEHMRFVMNECADAIWNNNEMGALRMLEACLRGDGRKPSTRDANK